MSRSIALAIAAVLCAASAVGCATNGSGALSPQAMRTPSADERAALLKAGYQESATAASDLATAANAAAEHACGRLYGKWAIVTPPLPSGYRDNNGMMPITFAPGIVVRCDYMDNWFVNRTTWIALLRTGSAYALRGPSFTTPDDALGYTANAPRFTRRQDIQIDAGTQLMNEAQSAYRAQCSKPPFTTGRVELQGKIATISCFAVRSDGTTDASRRVTYRIKLP